MVLLLKAAAATASRGKKISPMDTTSQAAPPPSCLSHNKSSLEDENESTDNTTSVNSDEDETMVNGDVVELQGNRAITVATATATALERTNESDAIDDDVASDVLLGEKSFVIVEDATKPPFLTPILRRRRQSIFASSNNTADTGSGTKNTTRRQPQRRRPPTPRRVKGLWEFDKGNNNTETSWTNTNSCNEPSMEQLQDETLLAILSFLNLADLLKTGMTCRRFRYHICTRNSTAKAGTTTATTKSQLQPNTKLKTKSQAQHKQQQQQPLPVLPHDPALYPLWKIVDATTFVQEAYQTFYKQHQRKLQQQSYPETKVPTDDDSNPTPKPAAQRRTSTTSKKSPEQWAREQTGKALARILQGKTPHSLTIRNIRKQLALELPSSLLASLRELTLTHFDTLTDTHLHVLLLLSLGGGRNGKSAASGLPVQRPSSAPSAHVNRSPPSQAKGANGKPRSFNRLRVLKLEHCPQLTNATVVSIAKTCQKHLKILSLRGDGQITSIQPLQELFVTRLREDKLLLGLDSLTCSERGRSVSPSCRVSPVPTTTTSTSHLSSFFAPPTPTAPPPPMPRSSVGSLFAPPSPKPQLNQSLMPRADSIASKSDKEGSMNRTNDMCDPPQKSDNDPRLVDPSVAFSLAASRNSMGSSISGSMASRNRPTSPTNNPLSSLFSPPGSSPPRPSLNLVLPSNVPKLPPSLTPPQDSHKNFFHPIGNGPSSNTSSLPQPNPAMLQRYHRHRRSLSQTFNVATHVGTGTSSNGTDKMDSFVRQMTSASGGHRIGTLEQLDVQGTSISPRHAVDCFWEIASHHATATATATAPSTVNDSDELWCWVCFKSLHLNGSTMGTTLSRESQVVADISATITSQDSSAPVENSWDKQEVERLQTVLDMDEVEELLLGNHTLCAVQRHIIKHQ